MADSLPYYGASGFCILNGLYFFFYKRYPESKWSGKFDLIGASHNIWHILIILTIYFGFLAGMDNYWERINVPCLN